MNSVTEEYIDLFEILNETKARVESFIDSISNGLPADGRQRLHTIKKNIDWDEMKEFLGVSLESQLERDDLLQILEAYRNTPSLKKLLHKKRDLDTSCMKIAEKIVSDSMNTIPYAVNSFMIH